MATYRPNSGGMRQWRQEMEKRQSDIIGQVARSHAGKPVALVEAELKRRFRASGLHPKDDLSALAEKIHHAAAD